MFAICCRHLLGISVATDTSRREPPEEPEWPLEPARVQMAFAAAYFETDRDPDEREALLWLESLDPPEIYAPPATERSAVTRYVPVNDTLTMPEQRPKQARTFPTMVMQDAEHDTTYLVWSKTIVPDELREAMHRLASNITRVGHSSAVVQVWIDESEELPNLLNEQRSNHGLQFWTPDSDAVVAANVVTMRVPARQMLDGLIRDYNEEEVEAFNKLEEQIAAAKGATKRKLKEEMKNRLNDIEPTVRRPLIRTTARYSKASTADSSRFSTVFDDQMLVLSKHESHNLGLESTLQLTAALRGTILAQFGDDEIPEWISGHKPDGTPSESPHLAIVTLPFVSAEYADGHLLGMALVFPRDIPPQERGQALKRLLYKPDGVANTIELKLGKAGMWKLIRDDAAAPALALRSSTWSGVSDPRSSGGSRYCDTWASVTPVVLDRFPKKNRRTNRAGWQEEVAHTIAKSCVAIGLPAPIEVDIDSCGWHRGAPGCVPDRSGFPMMKPRNNKPTRLQVHVRLRFSKAVIGPVIIGAGRYVGYGVCKPLSSDCWVKPEVWNKFPVRSQGDA